MSREEFGAHVCQALVDAGIDAVLSGGSCVSIWTEERYVSNDLDFITSGYESNRQIESALVQHGFERPSKQSRYFTHPESEYAIEFPPGPLALGRENGVFPSPGRGDRVSERGRHGLPGQFVQRRFGIEQIEMAGPAFHEQPNDGFGLGRVVRLFWREGIRGCGGAQFRRQAGLVEQMAQRQRAESASPAAQKLAPRSGRQDMRL